MIVSFDRTSPSPILAMSSPSMYIEPPAASRMRNRQRVRDDLPAPVRPTTPILNITVLFNDQKELV